MTDFVRGANPIWHLVDLSGNSFDDSCYLYVLENEIPYVPATVLHTPTGTPWANPIQFLANGTLPTDIYFDPNKLYRLEFRQNDGTLPPSQADALIYLIENYAPLGSSGSANGSSQALSTNQLSNPQFAAVNFDETYTIAGIANPDPIPLAPGWELVLEGNGSVTIERISLNDALTTPTNAPYALRLNFGAGWTSQPILRQRLMNNGVLWANQFVSSAITARIEGAPQDITLRLEDSEGAPIAVLDTITLTNHFVEYRDVAALPASTNADLPPDAHLDFQILLPQVGDVYLTSLQLTVGSSAPVAYQQTPVNRQLDQLFNYYKSPLFYKPIPSHLVGWDFTLNPAQFEGETVAAKATGANTSNYFWDQTIIFQSADAGVSVDRAPSGALQLTAEDDGQIALIQYLDGPSVRRLLSDELSVNIAGLTDIAGGIKGVVSLWKTEDAALPDLKTPNYRSLVQTLDAKGKPNALHGNWDEIPRQHLGDAVFELDEDDTLTDYQLMGWDLNDLASAGDATFFAIVVGFEPWVNGDTIELHSVSLCSGNIASRPAPQTEDAALRDCERFYEKSYNLDVLPGTTASASLVAPQVATIKDGSNDIYLRPQAFGFMYRTLKRLALPIIKLYSPVTGNVDAVHGHLALKGDAVTADGEINANRWLPIVGYGNKGAHFFPDNNITTLKLVSADPETEIAAAYISYHYVVDARLGII